jgi:hypothetical protein
VFIPSFANSSVESEGSPSILPITNIGLLIVAQSWRYVSKDRRHCRKSCKGQAKTQKNNHGAIQSFRATPDTVERRLLHTTEHVLSIKVGSACKADSVLAQESAISGVVVSGAIVIEACFGAGGTSFEPEIIFVLHGARTAAIE